MNGSNEQNLGKQPNKDLNDVYSYKLLVIHPDN